MSEIKQAIDGTEKAGNSQELQANHTIINWKNRTILHSYSNVLVDSEGDILREEGSGNLVLDGEVFDQWINQAMKDATLESIVGQFEESREVPEA